MENASKRGRPRKRPKDGDGNTVTVAKPTASAQIEPTERERLEAICDKTGRSMSYVVRAAIVLLLRQDDAGKLDWALSPEQAGFILYGNNGKA